MNQLQAVYSKVDRLLLMDKIYLQKNLKLSDLASQINQNEKLVSRAMNHFGQGNFNFIINKYRIDLAEEMISSGEYDHYTIEAIAGECGFSNKVSFYNAFKSHIGMSPKEYWALKQPKN